MRHDIFLCMERSIMSTYLVTGAAGFIGSALSRRLVTEGNTVVTIDNLSTGFESNIPEEVVFIQGDCGDAEVYKKLPDEQYDAIFHIAGQSSGEISFDDPIYDIRTNAESTLLLLQFALKNQCTRVIYASTMSVYGDKPDQPIAENERCIPESFYGVAKLASEHYLRIYEQYGVHSTALRLFNVYGPGQNLDNLRQGMASIFLSQMLKDKHIHVKGSPDRFRDLIYIDDVVDACIKTLNCNESWGKVINIATGKKTTVGELVEKLINSQEDEISVEYEGYTQGDIHGIYADISKMQSVLGIENLTPVDVGLQKMVRWAIAQQVS
jgi:UDP-glucose 4-epimerase